MEPLADLIQSIRRCYNYGSMYALERKFNKVGLTIQPTVSDRMLLCKIEDGRPLAEELLKDYMFIGSDRDFNVEIPAKLAECTIEFVKSTASEPSSVRDLQGQLSQHLALYGKIIVDDIGYIIQNQSLGDRATDKRINAISDAVDIPYGHGLALSENVEDETTDDEDIYESVRDFGGIDDINIDDVLRALELEED